MNFAPGWIPHSSTLRVSCGRRSFLSRARCCANLAGGFQVMATLFSGVYGALRAFDSPQLCDWHWRETLSQSRRADGSWKRSGIGLAQGMNLPAVAPGALRIYAGHVASYHQEVPTFRQSQVALHGTRPKSMGCRIPSNVHVEGPGLRAHISCGVVQCLKS